MAGAAEANLLDSLQKDLQSTGCGEIQWCCEEIFHTPTLTIVKKVLPPSSTALTTL